MAHIRFGYWWARQIALDPGHPDFVDEPWEGSDKFEVVEVVENCIDPSNPEYQKVQVLGMSQWQSIGNFQFAEYIEPPNGLKVDIDG
jgi:hypothetical protein